jgi:hypothetical protein
MNNYVRYWIVTLCKSVFIVSLIFVSCKKEPIAPIKIPTIIDTSYQIKGMYILNEGLFNMNNASLTYYNFSDSTPTTDYFKQQNGRQLGDIGNDLEIYGGKMYIVVSTSSQLEIVDLVTGKSIQRIPIFDGNKPRQPRKIAFCKNKAFLCSFDGTVEVIDTTSLTIETVIKVGRNPDGVAVVGNKIYISNSGGLDNPNYDKTVLVIDYNTLTEIKKIPVLINPTYMATDNYGDVYVVSRGNYDNVKMRLQVIDSKTDTVKKTFNDFEALNLTIKGDTAYVYYYDFTSGSGSKILLLNVKDETIIRQNFITDNTKIETVYGIAVHPLSGDVFITDAHNFTNMGEVFCFGANGKKKYSFKAGLNPSYMGFVNVARVDTVK